MLSLQTPGKIAFAFALALGILSLGTLSGCSDDKTTQVSKIGNKNTADASDFMKAGTYPENVMGNPDAKVTLVEYSSMTCPHCATFHKTTLPGLKKKYIDTGKVKYIIREFPLDNLAAYAFMLARCAPKDKYFAFVDTLYATQKVWAFGEGDPRAPLKKLAKQVGFTDESFDKCTNDQKLLDYINWMRKRGSEKFGVRSTPTFFINGEKYLGKMELGEFEKTIDPLLK